MRSNKLNSALDMLYDQLRRMVDYNWETLLDRFRSLDQDKSGRISRDHFKVQDTAELRSSAVRSTSCLSQRLWHKMTNAKQMDSSSSLPDLYC